MPHNYSYWEQTEFVYSADVIIIGSGIVGLSAALHLKKQQPTLKVLVLERGFLPSGASTKNAGFACFGTISEQISYPGRSSEAEVLGMVDYKWRGLQLLRQNRAIPQLIFSKTVGMNCSATTNKSKPKKPLIN
ncbi:FAD-dependent oxidoreductase [Mucilaginibacter humi]|uniref:FAD-dependent oxidoreductase n=1 Tax=Mucilaginibacter humi TaxID=2732510 RepID=UPI001C2E76C9|nr:FAD-binding oxidoreductase [Mucilaginibacter humi]